MSYQDQLTLQQVKLKLNRWRSRNGVPTPIPGEIWASLDHNLKLSESDILDLPFQ